MFIFNNSIGYFEELTKIINNAKKPIKTFQSSLFSLKTNSYKKFNIYLSGIAYIINAMLPEFPGFYYTLFIDSSIISNKPIYDKLLKIINNNKRVILIRYDFPMFKDAKHSDYHLELFGHIVRFAPWFNYENNPFGLSICIDTDDNQRLKFRYHMMINSYNVYNEEYRGKNKSYPQFVYCNFFNKVAMNSPYYEKRARNRYKQKNPYFCPANICGADMKVDKDLFENYLYECKFGKHLDLITNNSKFNYHNFGYGIDEIFLNDYLLPYMNEHNYLITPYITYDCFDATGIFKPARYEMHGKNKVPVFDAKLKKIVKQCMEGATIEQCAEIAQHMQDFRIKTFDAHYLTLYLILKYYYSHNDFNLIPKYSLSTMKFYEGYLMKYYFAVFKGDVLQKEDIMMSIKADGYQMTKYINPIMADDRMFGKAPFEKVEEKAELLKQVEKEEIKDNNNETINNDNETINNNETKDNVNNETINNDEIIDNKTKDNDN